MTSKNRTQAISPMTNVLTYEPNLVCYIKDHFNDQLDFICTHPQCMAETRLSCSYCQYRFHSSHLASTVKLKDFTFKTIKDSEILTRKLEQFNTSGDTSQLFEERLEQSIRERIDENSQTFNRYFAEQQEQLKQFIYDYSHLFSYQHSNIQSEITSFNDNLYKILHQPWRNQSKEDVEVLVKVYRNENFGEYLGEQDIERNPYFRVIQDQLDYFYNEVNFLLSRVIEDMTLKLKEMEIQYMKNNIGQSPAQQNQRKTRSRSNLPNNQEWGSVERTNNKGLSVDQSTPVLKRQMNSTIFTPNKSYEPSFQERAPQRRKSPVNRALNGGGSYLNDTKYGNHNMESSILAEHPDDQNSVFFLDQSVYPQENSKVKNSYPSYNRQNSDQNMRILPNLHNEENGISGNGLNSSRQNKPPYYGNSNASLASINPYLSSTIVPTERSSLVAAGNGSLRQNYPSDNSEIYSQKENPGDSSILVIGFEHIQSRTNGNSNQPYNTNPSNQNTNNSRDGGPRDQNRESTSNSSNSRLNNNGGNNTQNGPYNQNNPTNNANGNNNTNQEGSNGYSGNGNSSNINNAPNNNNGTNNNSNNLNNGGGNNNSSNPNNNPSSTLSNGNPNNSNNNNNTGYMNSSVSPLQTSTMEAAHPSKLNHGATILPQREAKNGLNDSGPGSEWKEHSEPIDTKINQALLSKVQQTNGVFKPISNQLYEGPNQLTRKHPQVKEGVIYEGHWLNGSREGYGICYLLDGSRYEGNWENDHAHGWGRVVHPNGNVFEGEWKNGKADGQGVYYYTNGTQYEGDWKDDQYHGIGIKTWINGSKYEGQYQMGQRDGRGKFLWPDGSQYQGEFKNNQICGRGVYKWNDGRIFTGDWREGKMNGNGIFKWADGRFYQGDYVDDKKEGYGVFIWPGGEKKYEGGWKNDQPHGMGTVTDQNNVQKQGQWVQGKNVQWFDVAV